MRQIYCILLLFSVASPIAAQTRWLTVYESPSITVALDTMRIDTNSDHTHTIWLRKEFLRSDSLIPALAQMYRRGTRSLISQEQIHCRSLKSRSLSGTYYTASGGIVSSYNDDSVDWTPAIPESIREAWLSKTCEYLRMRPSGTQPPDGSSD